MRALERRLPAFDRLDAVGRPPEVHVRHRPQRREMLDRLMRRTVLAEADGVVGEDVHDPDLHERGDAKRGSGVIGESTGTRRRRG